MKKRKWAHVATYTKTPLADGRDFSRLIQVDLFYAGAIVHKTIRKRNDEWQLDNRIYPWWCELVTSHKPRQFVIREEIDFWNLER